MLFLFQKLLPQSRCKFLYSFSGLPNLRQPCAPLPLTWVFSETHPSQPRIHNNEGSYLIGYLSNARCSASCLHTYIISSIHTRYTSSATGFTVLPIWNSFPFHPCLLKLYITCTYQLQPFPFPMELICFPPLLSLLFLLLVSCGLSPFKSSFFPSFQCWVSFITNSLWTRILLYISLGSYTAPSNVLSK